MGLELRGEVWTGNLFPSSDVESSQGFPMRLLWEKMTLKFLKALLFHRKDESWLHLYPEAAFS